MDWNAVILLLLKIAAVALLVMLNGFFVAAEFALVKIGEPVFTALLQPVFGWLHISSPEVRHVLAFVIGFSAITFLHISAGEQAPKWLAIQRPLPTTLWIAYPMLWFYRISYPFVVVLNSFSQWLLRQVGLEPATEAER